MKKRVNLIGKTNTVKFSAKFLLFAMFTICLLTILPMVSAWEFDNVETYNKIGDYGKYEIRNSVLGFEWWQLGKVADLELKDNSQCSRYCNSTKEITLYEDGILISDERYYTIKEDDSKVLQPIRSSEYFIINGKDRIPYQIGEKVSAGTYTILHEGEIKPGRIVDWQIKSNNIWTEAWAIWGNTTVEGIFLDDFAIGGGVNGNDDAHAIASNGTHLWITDQDKSVYLYFTNGTYTGTSWSTSGECTSGVPHGITTNNTFIYITCTLQDTAFRYNMAGAYTAVGFSLQPNAGLDIAMNDSNFWVVHDVGATISHYEADFTFIDSFEATEAATQNGIEYFSNLIWVSESEGDIFRYFDNGTYTGTTWDSNNRSQGIATDGISFFIPDGPSNKVSRFTGPSGGAVTLNSPADNSGSMLQEIQFEVSAILLGGSTLVNVSLFHNASGTFELNQTRIITGQTTNTSIFNATLPNGFTLWNARYCDSDGDCGFGGSNFTISIDNLPPNITINNPLGVLTSNALGLNETLNWTILEQDIDTIIFNYNGTNITVFGLSNITNFTLENSPFNLTMYANDSSGNFAEVSTNWSYVVFEINSSFNNVTFSGAEEVFTLDFLLGEGFIVSQALLQYNNTNFTSNIISLGDTIRLSNTINVPAVNNNTNFTFNFLTIIDGQQFETSPSTQLVAPINMTDCSDGGTVILNMSLFDERLKTNITGDIEINVQALDQSSLEEAGFVNLVFNDTGNAAICIGLSEALPNLFLDAEIRYTADNYAAELYHIQRADLSDAPINLSLFDLLSNESTEFLITYQDDDLILVTDAIIQLQRKYISEDLFETVEAPLTSDGGTAVVHIDLNTNKYRATVVKDGEVLDFFDNIVFNCESELSGQCTHELLGKINPQNDISVETLNDFSYSISQVNDTITVAFSIPSGVPANVNVFLNQIDQFNNSFPCNNTVFSSAGSVDCEITTTIGDSFLELTIKKADELQAQKGFIIQEDPALDFALNNYFILFILMLSVIGMAFTSPEWIIINAVMTMVIAGALYLANGLNFVVGLGNLIWLIVAAVIIIFKLSHQEDR